MPGKLLATSEAARALGISGRSLSRWVQDGLITPALTTAGGHYRFDLDDLRRQLLEMAQKDKSD